MSDVLPGVQAVLVDEPALGPGAPTDTHTAFLITADPNAPTVPTTFDSPAQAREAFGTATTLIAQLDGLLQEGRTTAGGPTVHAVKLASGATGLADTIAMLPRSLGPGQLLAPPVVTAQDIAVLAQWAIDTNRVYLANGPRDATNAALATLAQAVIDSGYGRNTALFADTAVVPGIGVATREIPWAVVVAGILARNDLSTGNPNLAPAGDQGVATYALGLVAERTDVEMTALTDAQVNVARQPTNGAVRGFGYRSLADTDVLPQWLQLGGARTVMDVRANVAAASDRMLFADIDAGGTTLAKWNGLLSARCLELVRLNALYGDALTAFNVDTGAGLNPLARLREGKLRAAIRLQTTPFIESIDLSIVRQPIT